MMHEGRTPKRDIFSVRSNVYIAEMRRTYQGSANGAPLACICVLQDRYSTAYYEASFGGGNARG